MNFKNGNGFYSAAITPFLIPFSDLKKPTACFAA
jgi:hypothetical protein